MLGGKGLGATIIGPVSVCVLFARLCGMCSCEWVGIYSNLMVDVCVCVCVCACVCVCVCMQSPYR